jgi:hypothetical protein
MMRPAFSSTKQAAAFALLLLVLLLLPVLAGKKILPPREQAYAAQSWGSGPFPWIRHEIFEETGDVDIAFVGSSHILCDVDTPYVQEKLARKLGRPAVVRTVGWGGAGFAALYFITRDLLEHRRVRLLVIYNENNDVSVRNAQGPMWFRWSEDAAALAGLPCREKGLYYFTAMVGMPRNLLCRLRPNIPADLVSTPPNYWESHYHTARMVDSLGSSSSKLGFNPSSLYDDYLPFVPFEPHTDARPADVCIDPPATNGFEFSSQPLPAWQTHFARKLVALAREHGCRLVLLHIPTIDEARSPVVTERKFWPEVLGAEGTILGIPPAKLFGGLTDEEIRKLYFNRSHLNKNGVEYFTPLITPALLHIYDSPTNH